MFSPKKRPGQSFSKIGTRINEWAPVCIPTYVFGFDKLIHGGKDAEGKETGGLPLSSPGVTTLAGGPGTGKSMFCYNMVVSHLMKGNKVLWFTLEKPIKEVGWNILNIAEKLGLTLDCETGDDYYIIKGFECVDYFSSGVGKRTAIEMANRIIDWQRRTHGVLVVVDSITELTVYEMHLRNVLKNFITTISSDFVKKKIQIALLITSQYRGTSRDGGLAGGLAIGHRSNAVVQLDASFVTNFDKAYYNTPRGTQVRRIWVQKTASFAHDTSEHFLNISKDGIVTVSDLAITAFSDLKCTICDNPVDVKSDHIIQYRGKSRKVAHKDCFLSQQKRPTKSKGSAGFF